MHTILMLLGRKSITRRSNNAYSTHPMQKGEIPSQPTNAHNTRRNQSLGVAGISKRRCELTWKRRKCIFFYLPASYGCSINVGAVEVLFLLRIWTAQGAAMLAGSSPTKSRKKVVSWRSVHSCHTCRSVHDTTDKCSRLCFRDFQPLI